MTRPAPKVIDLSAVRMAQHFEALPRSHTNPAAHARARRALWTGVILASVALGMMMAVTAFAKAHHDTAGMICPAPC